MENKKFWTEFIEVYRDHACLWNVKFKDYSNKYKRNASYEILLKKLKETCPHATMEILKKKINNMRTTFRREFRKVARSKHTGTGENPYEPSLWYYDLLLFTAESGYTKRDKSTDKLEDSENDPMDITDEIEYKEEYPDTPLTSSTPTSNNNSDMPYLTTEDTQVATNNSRKRTSTTKSSKYDMNNTKDQKISNLLDLVHKALTKDEDEYQIVGKRIAYQLKGITKSQQIIAEKLISDVIYYAKIEKLTEDASVHCKSNHSNSQLQSSISLP